MKRLLPFLAILAVAAAAFGAFNLGQADSAKDSQNLSKEVGIDAGQGAPQKGSCGACPGK